MDLWLKAFHVMAVIAWMAGLLYLPRLYVYHAEQRLGSAASQTFKVMEDRLLRVIMNPAMIAVWITGLWYAWMSGALDNALDFSQFWLWAKFALVCLMTAFHMFLAACRRAFAEDRNARPARFYRMINEAPAALMALIVILVVVKPF